MLYGIPCYWAKFHGRPDCGGWLLGASEEPPDHVCYDIARASVQMFATQCSVVTCELDTWYQSAWPLPAGRQAMCDWHQKYGGDAPATWLSHPLLEDPMAQIGLAVMRRRETGSMWFLGLVKQVKTPGYVFSGSALRIEGDYTTLRDEANLVARWYAKTVLGKVMRGRPPGSGTFENRQEFVECVGAVIDELIEHGEKPTQERVAEYMSNHSHLPCCDDRRIRDWCKRFGVDWEDLIRR